MNQYVKHHNGDHNNVLYLLKVHGKFHASTHILCFAHLCLVLQAPFCDRQLNPPFHFFSKKVEVSIPEEAFTRIIFAWKIFLTDLFVWQNNCQMCANWITTFINSIVVTYATICNSKSCRAHKKQLKSQLKTEIW